MSIKVVKHGPRRVINNPARPGEKTFEIPVTFQEEGRGGLNEGLQQSGDLLSEFAGKQVGLNQVRTHTFAVKEDAIGAFKVGAELPFFINRKITSVPQMRQQENVQGRLIDGKLTYVSTYLSRTQEKDLDLRESTETMAKINPAAIANAITGTAAVYNTEEQPATANVGQGTPVQHEQLTQ